MVSLLYRQLGAETEQFFPYGHLVRYRSGLCTYLDKWLHRFEEVPLRSADVRFACFGELSVCSEFIRRLVDPGAGAPVVVEPGHRGYVEYLELAPRRLPATSPWSELVLDGATPVVTGDGTGCQSKPGLLTAVLLAPTQSGSRYYRGGHRRM